MAEILKMDNSWNKVLIYGCLFQALYHIKSCSKVVHLLVLNLCLVFLNTSLLFVPWVRNNYLNQSTPGVKKDWTRTIKALLKRCDIEMGSQGLLFLIRLKLWSSWPHCKTLLILNAQGLLMLMGSKCLIKVSRQCIWSHQHQETLSTEITMFCSEVMMIKSFNPIKSRRPWSSILILHLYQQDLFSSRSRQLLFYYTWVFWFRFHFVLEKGLL